MLPLLLGLAAGFGLPVQTAINSRLRFAAGSPLFASLVNFGVGTAFLLTILTVSGRVGALTGAPGAGTGWWMWTGGVLGFVFLTLNIVLFPQLGSVETAIWPVVGQVLMALAIDAGGWFGGQRRALSVMAALGAVLVLVGVVLAVALRARGGLAREATAGARGAARWAWRAAAALAGAGAATQATINGSLGRALGSALPAAVVSFAVGTLILVVAVLATRSLPRERGTAHRGPRWMWLGGFLGATYVFLMSALVPIIGTGMTMILALLGQVSSSVCVDHLGWLGARRRPVSPLQLLGLAIMVAGTALVRLS